MSSDRNHTSIESSNLLFSGSESVSKEHPFLHPASNSMSQSVEYNHNTASIYKWTPCLEWDNTGRCKYGEGCYRKHGAEDSRIAPQGWEKKRQMRIGSSNNSGQLTSAALVSSNHHSTSNTSQLVSPQKLVSKRPNLSSVDLIEKQNSNLDHIGPYPAGQDSVSGIASNSLPIRSSEANHSQNNQQYINPNQSTYSNSNQSYSNSNLNYSNSNSNTNSSYSNYSNSSPSYSNSNPNCSNSNPSYSNSYSSLPQIGSPESISSMGSAATSPTVLSPILSRLTISNQYQQQSNQQHQSNLQHQSNHQSNLHQQSNLQQQSNPQFFRDPSSFSSYINPDGSQTLVEKPWIWQPCRHWAESGSCRYGESCKYRHGTEDRRERPAPRPTNSSSSTTSTSHHHHHHHLLLRSNSNSSMESDSLFGSLRPTIPLQPIGAQIISPNASLGNLPPMTSTTGLISPMSNSSIYSSQSNAFWDLFNPIASAGSSGRLTPPPVDSSIQIISNLSDHLRNLSMQYPDSLEFAAELNTLQIQSMIAIQLQREVFLPLSLQDSMRALLHAIAMSSNPREWQQALIRVLDFLNVLLDHLFNKFVSVNISSPSSSFGQLPVDIPSKLSHVQPYIGGRLSGSISELYELGTRAAAGLFAPTQEEVITILEQLRRVAASASKSVPLASQ